MLRLQRFVQCTFYSSICIFFMLSAGIVHAQDCSSENIAAKYWQYKKNLDKHFILIDRDPTNGCINDGIGQDPQNLCSCSKSGYSLPATSIDQLPNGSLRQGDRNNNQNYPQWYDDGCDNAGPDPRTHFGNNSKHNVLTVGSETPHQMGWYWVTLATQYQLLINNGQTSEAHRTLEELFLGLQAYRRLDITANCLARDRYEEITNNFETNDDCSVTFPNTNWHIASFKACLCDFRYRNNIPPPGENPGCEKKNFDSPCNGNEVCNFVPRTDGYSGFYLREDATQNLEILHDPSEDKWNIDAVQSDHAFSLSPPCTSVFSPACYNVHRQNFMSQDGLIALMVGLAMIKRYIPANATVTTCDGTAYTPLSIAIEIGNSLTDRVFDAYQDRISWPRSGFKDCCRKEVFFSACEGGHLVFIAKGLKKAMSYLDEHDHTANANETIQWGLLTGYTSLSSNSNTKFWLRLKSIGWDMGGDVDKVNYLSATFLQGQEIYPMMNNLLYPSSPNLPIDKAGMKALLCSAPCGGPCKRTEDFNSNLQDFECSNTPNWVGQRWESHSNDSDDNRQFNGLDFMALYNLYLLQFPEEQTAYFNPDKPEGDIGVNSGNISGPGILCSGSSGVYTVLTVLPTEVQNLAWTTSSNLSVTNTSVLSATILANSNAYSNQFVQAAFNRSHQVQQFYNGLPNHRVGNSSPVLIVDNGTINDVCDITYRKPIHNEIPIFEITWNINHCNATYVFLATPQGLAIQSGTTYAWTFIVHPNGSNTTTTFTATGQNPSIIPIPYGPIPGNAGFIETKLVVTSSCGTKEFNNIYAQYWGCNPGRQIIVFPNPTSSGNQVSVNITDSYVVASSGLDVRLIRTSTGSVQSTQRIYSNGASINTSGLPTGNYTVRVALEDSSVLTTTMVIN